MKTKILLSLLLLFSISCNKENVENATSFKEDIMTLRDDSTIFAKEDLASKYARVATVDLSKKIAKVLYVMDYDLYVGLGSNEAACSTYIYNNHNLAMKAFEAANIYNKIEKIIILKTPSVFTPITSALTMLSVFNTTYYPENFNTKILLFNKNLGGYAFTNGINSSGGNSLICGVFTNNSYWNSFNIAHELGHHYGSPHTHVCWKFPDGTTRRIDSCFAGCNQTNKKFTYNGTVMSYCYNNGTIKLPLVFHPLCIDTMVKTFSRNTSIPADGGVIVNPPTPPTTMTVDTTGLPFNKLGFKLSRDNNFAVNTSRWLVAGPSSVTFNNVNKNITNLTLHTGFLSGNTWNSPVKSLQVIVNGVVFYTVTNNTLTTLIIPINANTTSLRILFRDTDFNRVREIIF